MRTLIVLLVVFAYVHAANDLAKGSSEIQIERLETTVQPHPAELQEVVIAPGTDLESPSRFPFSTLEQIESHVKRNKMIYYPIILLGVAAALGLLIWAIVRTVLAIIALVDSIKHMGPITFPKFPTSD